MMYAACLLEPEEERASEEPARRSGTEGTNALGGAPQQDQSRTLAPLGGLTFHTAPL